MIKIKEYKNKEILLRQIAQRRPMLKNVECLSDEEIRRELRNFSLYESTDKRGYAINKDAIYEYGMEGMYIVSFTEWHQYARMLTYVEWLRYILFSIGTPIDEIDYYLENVVDNFNHYLSIYRIKHSLI